MVNQKIKQHKTGKLILLSVVALFSFCGFLLANIPAKKLWHYLPTDHLPVELKGINGTAWSGMAESLLIQGTKTPLLVSELRWQIEPTQLLQGKFKINVQIGGAALPISGAGTITVTRNDLAIENLALDTTAQWLVDASGQKLPASVAGNVFLQLDELKLNNNGCQSAKGDAQWAQSQLDSFFGQFDLGNTTATISCQGGELVAKIRQSSPILKSNGDFRLGIKGGYTFTGNMTPEESIPESVKNGLKMLPYPDANGAYPLKFSGFIN